MNESFKNRQNNRHTILFTKKTPKTKTENNFPFLVLKSNTEYPKLTGSLKTERKKFVSTQNFLLNHSIGWSFLGGWPREHT